MTETIVKTPYNREITVRHNYAGIYLKSDEPNNSKPYIQAFLTNENATELGTALLEAAGETAHTELGELPAVVEDPFDNGYLNCGGVSRRVTADPDELLKLAKAFFAISKELQKRADDKVAEQKAAEAAKAEAEKAATAKLNKRRDELVKELSGSKWVTDYHEVTSTARNAIDKIIELEGKVSKPKPYWV